MLELFDRIWVWLLVKRAVWQRGNRPYVPGELEEAFAEARRKFPNDRVQQEARAKAVLALRELTGQRKFDA